MRSSDDASTIIAWLTCGYLALLIYASLMPYDFNLNVDVAWVTARALHAWPINPYARISGSDVLSNLLLYIPLGFLASTLSASKKWGKISGFCMASSLCIVTSIGVESAQIFSMSRTASITDLLMNSISGALGAGAGTCYGLMLWRKTRTAISARRQNSPADILTLILAALIAADALAPFLPTLLVSQVWRHIKASTFDPLTGFSLHPWHWWLVTHVMVYMTLTLLSAQWQTSTNAKLGVMKAGILCCAFTVVLEVGKLFIASRSMNLSNILANTSGIIAAVIVLRCYSGSLGRTARLNLGLSGMIIYSLYLGWTPFDFVFNPRQIAEKIPQGVEFLPFYHYAMGSSLNHVRLFLQTMLLSGSIAYMFCLRFSERGKTWYIPLGAFLLCTLLGVLQEGGQMLLPSRTPSMTDIYCYMLGGISGIFSGLKFPLPAEPCTAETCDYHYPRNLSEQANTDD